MNQTNFYSLNLVIWFYISQKVEKEDKDKDSFYTASNDEIDIEYTISPKILY